ncbi:related to step II splicing factor SLU7 [Ustilago sp. UG-2017a]|nr:related to step II splicing factor SLU7 [Ustilago sp. UG-2017a]
MSSTPSTSSAPPGKLSRTEFRRLKDLEEDRKAGRAPAELDEDGNIINPHVPSYMAQAPWYMDTGSKSLKHQKKPIDPNAHKASINDWYNRGSSSSSSSLPAPNKFRKGACENCGSVTHKTRDCLERPRKKGAKKLGKTLAGDHILSEPQGLDYAAKRDRWNGYDPSEHKEVIEEFEAIEQERRRLKEEQIDHQTSSDLKHAKKLAQKASKSTHNHNNGNKDALDFSSDESDSSNKDKYADKADAVGQKVDNRMTIRNLRIREDRAKYLYNLDVNSAYYDPKTRTMREAPNPNIRPEDAEYAGDNFARAQGSQAGSLANLQLFSWQAETRAAVGGTDVNLQANPTANERQYREFKQRREKLKQDMRGTILDKYGGEQHFDAPPEQLLKGQTEVYVEYNQQGKLVNGLGARGVVKSKWEEGKTENNHKQVWGSWYDIERGEWGYGCCRSCVCNSYCTGEAGIAAAQASSTVPSISKKEEKPTEKDKNEKESRNKRTRSRSHYTSSPPSYSNSSSDSSSSNSRHHRRHHKHRSSKPHNRRSKSRSPPTSFISQKHLGSRTVSSRLNKDRLDTAILAERAKNDPGLAARLEAERQKRFDALPDWAKDAEIINSKVYRHRKLDGDRGNVDVTEEQLEAYRLVNRQGGAGLSEDPMANYRDEEEE